MSAPTARCGQYLVVQGRGPGYSITRAVDAVTGGSSTRTVLGARERSAQNARGPNILQNGGRVLGASFGSIGEYGRVAGEAVEAAGRKQARTLALLGGVLVGVSAVVFVRLAGWLVVDSGYLSNGSALLDPGRARAALVPAAVGIGFGVGLLLLRGRLGQSPRSGLIAVAVLAVVSLGVIVLSSRWYPCGSRAVVVALDRDTGAVQWRVRTPATQLFGVRTVTEDQVTVEGSITHRGCGYDFVAITIDRISGTVTEVTTLPTFFPNAESAPPAPAPPSPNEFVFEQGRTNVSCSS